MVENYYLKKTKGFIEAEVCKIVTHWQKDNFGRGAVSIKADILRDKVIVVLHGILTPAEHSLCETKQGILSVKKFRSDLIESGAAEINQMIQNKIGEEVISFFTDISTKTGERLIVFKFSKNLEETN